jgi:endopeptidase La
MLLNTSYNDSLPVYKTLKCDLDNNEKKFIQNDNLDGYMKYMIFDNDKLRSHINNYFLNVDDEIYELMNNVGSVSIADIFRLKIGDNYREIMDIDNDVNYLKKYIQNNKKNINLNDLQFEIHNSAVLIDILIKYFIPVEMKISKKVFDNNKTTVLINKYVYEKNISTEESMKFKFEVMLDNCYKITIKCSKTRTTYVLFGYFSYDVTNTIIVTSQVCNNFIYYKKKCLIDYVREKANINKEYKDIYLNNLTLGEILSYKGDNLIEKIMTDYELYTKSCNIRFKITVNDFLNSNLHKKFAILRSLLFGPKNSIKCAAMLFGMTKDQNTDSKNNKACVADILFRNLNHSQQSKLKKSGQYVKQELERIKNLTSDDMDLKQQCIMNNNMSDNVKKNVMSRLDEMKSNSTEYHKNLVYVKTLIDYPWISNDYCDMFTSISSDLAKCREKLKMIKNDFDSKVYGQTEFKNVICDIVGKWLTNPKSMGKAIGLCGPPGCGKTLIAKDLGRVLNIPFQEIQVGGLEDGSVLSGHSFTYSGAQPGLIVTKMVAAGEPRCVLYFDELDKASQKHGINEIFNILIHATDPNTNSNFNDKFFQDVTFPLNKVIFVFSFNDESKIDPILRDRMEIIKVLPYSMNDKIEITKKYLFPELLNDVGIKSDSIIMSSQTIEHIISQYTLEAGVRKLKQCIEKIFLKLNVDRIYARGPFKKSNINQINITLKHVLEYLGKPHINHEKIHTYDQIGVINGLYATTAGQGGILPILIYPAINGSHKKPVLELTGKQGKVMKESVSFAWTVAKNCTKPDIVKKFYHNNCGGLHVHAPDGAVSKDGPSAGAAFTTAFISRLTGLAIKRNIAMTGEISIGGNVTAIGGLEFKLTGAKVAGIKLVFVCEENLDDLKKIKETNSGLFNLINPYDNPKVSKIIKQSCKKKNSNIGDFKIIVINTIYDIIPYCLIDPKYGDYDVYDKTCDWEDYMIMNNDGFNNMNDTDDIKSQSEIVEGGDDDDGDDDDDDDNADNYEEESSS